MRLEDFKNKYEGTIWVVGNGPSQCVDDIRGCSIAANRIALIYDTTQWRPSFFYSHTRREDWYDDYIRSIELGIPCFLHEKLKLLGDYDNVVWIRTSELFCGLSGYRMAKLAAYMGFDDIRFTGMDGDWQPVDGDDINHFHPDYLRNVNEEEAERWTHKHKEFTDWITKHTT